jgi:hypothetical protein
MHNKRLLFGLGTGALALIMSGFVIVGGTSLTRDSVYLTDGPAYTDIDELTHAAEAVAHVKILSASPSYTIPFDPPVVNVAPPHTDGRKATAPKSAAIPPAGQHDPGIVHTDFTVEVLDAVRGTGVRTGDRLVVTQLGGSLPNGSKVTSEHDPMMQPGDQEVLFLRHDAKSGKYFTTGGGQGRFKIQSTGQVTALDPDSPFARQTTGKSLGFLKGAVQAVAH